MHQTLHQRLAAKRTQLAFDEAVAIDRGADPRDAHEAKQRLQGHRMEIEKLEAAIAFGEEALHRYEQAMGMIANIAEHAGGRDLALSQTYGETAVWRLQRHLGTAVEGEAN